MGAITSCCALRDNKGEEELRNIMFSMGIANITEIDFINDLKERAKEDLILVTDFMDYMNNHWSTNTNLRQLQIGLFNKYFSATLSREICIYELSLLLLPFFKLSYDEKKKTFQEAIKSLTKPKYMYKSVKEMINLFFNFHTIFITKIIYFDFKAENKIKESNDLRSLLLSVFTEEQVHKEVDSILSDFENDINKKAYLSAYDLEILSNRVILSFSDLRDYFINKYFAL